MDWLNEQRKRHQESNSSDDDGSCCSGKKLFYYLGIGAVLITGLSVLAASLKRVESTEHGVQYNVHRKKLDDAAKSGGLFIGPPGYEFIKFPSTYITVDLPDDTCVSRDGLRVEFSVTFQYKLPAANVVDVALKYRNFDKWATLVEVAGVSAVHQSCSEFNVVDFQKQRGLVQSAMEQNLKLKLEGDGDEDVGMLANALSLQLRNVNVPNAYRTAVHEKQRAAEDIELAKSQRIQSLTQAQTDLLTANEEARKIEETADNDAEIMLTEARADAEATTFAFQTEADTLTRVKEQLNLTSEGVLAYMANGLVASAPHVEITSGEPAKLSRRDEL